MAVLLHLRLKHCIESPGRILRAACPVNANEEDVLLLREMLQITRLVCPSQPPVWSISCVQCFPCFYSVML